jgi:hypothetical protein
MLWTSTVVYTIALVGQAVTVDSAPGTPGDQVFAGCLLLCLLVGGLQAIALAVLATANSYHGKSPVEQATVAEEDREWGEHPPR